MRITVTQVRQQVMGDIYRVRGRSQQHLQELVTCVLPSWFGSARGSLGAAHGLLAELDQIRQVVVIYFALFLYLAREGSQQRSVGGALSIIGLFEDEYE